MGLNKQIRPCPQHEPGSQPPTKLTYLLRTCPDCMKWLGEHPQDARLARQSVPRLGERRGGYLAHADRRRFKKRRMRA